MVFEHNLLSASDHRKMSNDKKMFSGVLLTDLSKALDCLLHDLLIAQLNTYGFDLKSLHLLNNYLTSRCQRIRICYNYSSRRVIINGVPQGSILGPTIFNIYLIDLFFYTTLSEIASFVDDKTHTPKQTRFSSRDVSNLIVKWVNDNALKANPDKFHLLLNSHNDEIYIDIDNHRKYNSPHEKLLGIYILIINSHLMNMLLGYVIKLPKNTMLWQEFLAI